MAHRKSVHIQIVPNTWLGRLLVVAAAAVLLILAFFFLTFVLVMVGVTMVAVLIRLLLPTQKSRERAPDGVIEGEYSIESDEHKSVDSTVPTAKKQ